MKPLVVFFLIVNLILLFTEISIQVPKKILCSGKPCNIILIVADTLGAKHLSLYGYERQTSPFIDSFFSQNTLIFKNAISNATWTNPSFASFLTSRYPSEIPVAQWTDKIPSKTANFVEILRRAGVNVKLISQENNVGVEGINRADESVFRESEVSISTEDLLFFSSSEWLKNQKTKSVPFFLLIHNWRVHDPYDSPSEYRNLFTTEGPTSPIYYSEIKSAKDNLSAGRTLEKNFERFKLAYDQEVRVLDDELKNFFASLDKETIDNSIIIFTADHGEAFGEHNLLGHSVAPYQELIHVPLLIHLPGQKTKIIERNVSLLDLAPTILEIYDIRPSKEFQGASLWQFILSDESKKRILKSEFFGLYSERINSKDNKEPNTEKLIKNSTEARILDNWKLIKNRHSQSELYNLKTDPEEKNNLFNKLSEFKDEDEKLVRLLLSE